MQKMRVQGNVVLVGRKSPYSLYSQTLSSFEDDGGAYDQADAAGFIKLQARTAISTASTLAEFTLCVVALPARRRDAGAHNAVVLHGVVGP